MKGARAFAAVVAVAALVLLGGCTRKVYVPVESTSESVSLVERCSVVTLLDTVRVSVELPEATATAVVADTVSRLRTAYAESEAVWSGGMLRHTLRNLPQELGADVAVAHTVETRTVELRDTVRIVQPVEVPAQLGAGQRLKLRLFWPLAVAALALALWTWRAPIGRFMARIR